MSDTASRPTVLDALFIGMELSWLVAALLLIDVGVTPAGQPGLVWTALAYPAAYLLSRLLRRRPLKPEWDFLWAALGMVLALTVALKLLLLPGLPWSQAGQLAWGRVSLLLISGCFAWLRGWLLGQRRVDVAGFAAALQLGLILLLGATIIGGLVNAPQGGARVLILTFFACGLIGLWLARVRSPKTGPPQKVRGPWVAVVLVSLGLVLALGLLLGGLLDRSLLELLMAPLVWLWDRWIEFLEWLRQLFASDEPRQLPPPMPAMPTPGEKEMEIYRSWFDRLAWLRPVAEVMFAGLWIVAIGTVLLQNLLRLARWLAGRRRSDGGEYESLSVNWLDAWRGLLRRLIYLLITPFRLAWGLLRARRQGLGEREAAVRRIYTRFLLWAAARGVRRAPSQTPHEFLNELSPRLPGHLADLEALTHGYALVRYGPPGSHGPLVRDMSRALGRLKKARLSKKIEGKSGL